MRVITMSRCGSVPRNGVRLHFGDTVPTPSSRRLLNLCAPMQITKVATVAGVQTRIARNEGLVQKVAPGVLDA